MGTDEELDEQVDDLENDIDDDPSQSDVYEEPEKDEEDENNDRQDRGEQTSGSSGGIGGAVAGAVAAVTVLIFAAISNLTVKFDRLDVFGKSIEYGIVVNMEYDVSIDPNVDWNNTDTGLMVVVSNSKEVYSKPLITSDEGTEVSVKPKSEAEDNTIYIVELKFDGKFEGLTEHRPYKVSVIGDDNGETKVYCDKDVNTSGPLTEIRGIEGHCSCTVDGMYHFKLKYTDDGDYYQSFAYRLLDANGKAIASAEIKNPKSEQGIPGVDQLKGSDYTLEITITSTKPTDVEAEQFSQKLGDRTQLQIDHGVIVLSQGIEI